MFHEGEGDFHAIHSSEYSLDLIQIFIKLVFAEFCNFYDFPLCRGIFFSCQNHSCIATDPRDF